MFHCKNNRNSHWRCYVKECAFKNFTNFTEKHQYQSLFLKKATDLQVCNFIKKKLQCRCFPVKLVKFQRTSTLMNIYERVLLKTSTLEKKNHLSIFYLQNYVLIIITITFEALKFLLSFSADKVFANLFFKNILSSLMCYLSSSELIDYHVENLFPEIKKFIFTQKLSRKKFQIGRKYN